MADHWGIDRYRKATTLTAAVTLVWFTAGVAIWTDVLPPAWYRWVLSAGFGIWVWCVAGSRGWLERR